MNKYNNRDSLKYKLRSMSFLMIYHKMLYNTIFCTTDSKINIKKHLV